MWDRDLDDEDWKRGTSWDDDIDADDESDFPVSDDDYLSFPCASCGEMVFEDAELCPHCGEFFSRSTHPLSDKPQWYVWLAVLGIVAVILTLALPF